MKVNFFGALLVIAGLAIILAIHWGGEWFDILMRCWPLIFVIRGINNWERDDQSKSFQVAQIALGGFLVYDNFVPVDFSGDIYRWWPVLLIVIGLDMILRRERNGWRGCRVVVNSESGGAAAGEISAYHLIREMPDGVQRGKVDIEFNAGVLKIGGRTAGFFEADVNSSIMEPEITWNPGIVTSLRVGQRGVNLLGGGDNTWNLRFTDAVPLEFMVEANAGLADLDLSAYRVERVDLEGNAGKVTVKIGRLQQQSTVNVEVNAGKLTVLVPSDTGIRAAGESNLGSAQLSRAGLEKTNGEWRTPGFEAAERKVEIKFEANLSSFEIVRY
ncbi:MAG: hypothetical protein HRF49_12075 [bacterium]